MTVTYFCFNFKQKQKVQEFPVKQSIWKKVEYQRQ